MEEIPPHFVRSGYVTGPKRSFAPVTNYGHEIGAFMSSIERQLETVLAVYQKRGRLAIEALDADDDDKAMDLLRWRVAAYNNFRALEFRFDRMGRTIQEIAGLKNIWMMIEKDQTELEAKLKKKLQGMKRSMADTHVVRHKLSKFHSGIPDPNTLQRSV